MSHGVYLVEFVDGDTAVVGEELALEYAREWRLANSGQMTRTVLSIDRLVPTDFEGNGNGGVA